jgi:hypothetical protein
VEITLTVTDALAILFGSDALVAVMSTGTEEATLGAVKIPWESIVPALALQITAVSAEFAMLAIKRWTPPEETTAVSGEIVGVTEFAVDSVDLDETGVNEQAELAITTASIRPRSKR